MSLEEYQDKRNFEETPEPAGEVEFTGQHRFVVQKHAASKLHYDFRMEIAGVLASWAIPKGPSMNPADKRLAMQVEDHPLGYYDFEGVIPSGYGAGTVMLWDWGKFEPLGDTPIEEQWKAGKMEFTLRGRKISGEFALFQMKGGGRSGAEWLLVKRRDGSEIENWDVEPLGYSIKTNRTMDEIKQNAPPRDQPPEIKAMAKIDRSASVKSRPRLAEAKPVAKRERIQLPPEYLPHEWYSGDLPFSKDTKEAVIELSGREVKITNLKRLYFPEDGLTKGDLLEYYFQAAGLMQPFTHSRPMNLQRFPEGIHGESFYQKQAPDNTPNWVHLASVFAEESQRDTNYIIGDDRATLLYLANMGNIAIHPWSSRLESLANPDFLIFDLDPALKIWNPVVIDLAFKLREILQAEGLRPYLKTSGKSGLHVLIPLEPKYTYEQVQDYAERVAKKTLNQAKGIATLERNVHERGASEVYLDFLQNGIGKTVVAPYSVRAIVHAPVSTPMHWEELEALTDVFDPAQFNMQSIPERMKNQSDPWQEFFNTRCELPG